MYEKSLGTEVEFNGFPTADGGAFYEGQKTAEEVADIIQSRVSLYLNENM